MLTEVPEMFGAEPVLLNRCESREIFDRCVEMINDCRDDYIRNGLPISENPSPGNRAGGLTTLEEKSLGCVQKGGSSPVVDVLRYGETLRKPGLSLLEGPGDDMVAITALAAAGVHIILFTTGRGTPMGGPAPTVKISTNSELARRKKRWIDFDAGTLLHGQDMTGLADGLFNLVLDVASGRRRTRNEENGYRDIAVFKGVTL